MVTSKASSSNINFHISDAVAVLGSNRAASHYVWDDTLDHAHKKGHSDINNLCTKKKKKMMMMI